MKSNNNNEINDTTMMTATTTKSLAMMMMMMNFLYLFSFQFSNFRENTVQTLAHTHTQRTLRLRTRLFVYRKTFNAIDIKAIKVTIFSVYLSGASHHQHILLIKSYCF